MSAPTRIGFIGIGMMGHGMAKNLLAKGFALTFKANRNRSSLDDLLAAGAQEAKHATPRWRAAPTSSSSASPARRRSRRSSTATRACSPAPRDGLIVVDTSTAEPASTEKHPRRLRRARHALHRRAAGAHAEGSRGRPPEHHGRRRAGRLRGDRAGAARPSARTSSTSARRAGPCAQAGQQHAGDDDGRVDRRSRRGRRQERALRSTSCSRWSRPAASTPASSR